jgi:hypothetical protein
LRLSYDSVAYLKMIIPIFQISDFIRSYFNFNSAFTRSYLSEVDYRKCKESHEKQYNKTLVYRLVCTDYSWATIHSIIETLNNENVITYAKNHLGLLTDSNEIDRGLYSKSFIFDLLPPPLPNFGIVFIVIIDIELPFK